MSKKVALITGASSGIGRETAFDLQNRGFIVYGAARRVDRMKDLQARGIHVLELDITNEESMVNAVNTIIEKQGRIDVLINNAGYGSYGAVEDVDIQEAKNQFEVNIFGLARMVQLVLPSMRAHHYGKIVNISSMAGRVWTPFGAWYHATKYAVEGLSASLRMEVQQFGIDVIIIEPGGIQTDWGRIAAEHLRKTSGKGAYSKEAAAAANNMSKVYSGSSLTPPSKVALCIGRAVTTKKPKTRYLMGYGAKLAVTTHSLLGDRIYDKIIKKIM